MIRPIFVLILLLSTVNAAAQINEFQRVQILSGDYSGLPVQDAPDGPEFGYSVAIDGDWLAVGAPGTVVMNNDADVEGAGAVFLFKHEDGAWQFKQRLRFVFANMRCGTSVALKQPYLVVGCPGIPDQSTFDLAFLGRARLSESGEWVNLLTTTSGNGTGCGMSVALSAPHPADGSVVAAAGCPDAAGGKGHALFVEYDGGDWLTGWSWPFFSPITAGDGVAGDRFGESVALWHSDLTLVHRSLAVGAPRRNGDKGAVYLFEGTSWTQTTQFSNVTFETYLSGAAVAISQTELIIGKPGSSPNTTSCFPVSSCGTVAHFRRGFPGDSWSSEGEDGARNWGGSPPGEQYGMAFGAAVAIGPDGFLAVAAPQTDGKFATVQPSTAEDTGMVELRRGSLGSAASYKGEIRPDPVLIGYEEGRFGTSLDFSGSVLAVGYPYVPTSPPLLGGGPRGQVWIYDIGRVFADRFEG